MARPGETPLDRFFFQVLEEALRSVGDTVTLIPDADQSQHDIGWFLGPLDASVWEPIQGGLTQGFGGLLTIRAPEGDLEAWKTVRTLGQVRHMGRVALLRSDSPWVAIWNGAGLPYRIDNTRTGGLSPGTFRLVSLAELSLELERSRLPPIPAPVFFQTSADWGLYIRTTRDRDFRDRFRAAFQRGWRELVNSGRLGFLLRAYFLPAYQDLGLREAHVVLIP